MKLKAYSHNKPLKHLVLHTVKRFLWLPIVMLVLTSLAFIATEFLDDNREPQHLGTTKDFVFNNSEVWELFPLFLILISVVSAYVMFAFLFKKKSASMMMLTGVSRIELFITRYIFGLLSVLVPFLMSFSVLLSLGAANVDKGVIVTRNMVILVLMLAATVIYSYTAAVIAASLCGRKLEFFVVLGVFMLGAEGLLMFISIMFAAFLHGFPYPIRLEVEVPYSFGDIFDKYSFISIRTLFKDALGEYVISGDYEAYPVDMGVYASELIWLSAVTLLLIPLAALVFKKRNSEYDGKSNSKKILSAVCSVIIALTFSSLPLCFGSSFPLVLCSVALFAVLALVFYSFFDGTVRNLLSSLKFVAPATAVLVLFILILNFDVFGYSQKIPDINDIESVYLTYKGDYRGIYNKSASGNDNIVSTTLVIDYLPALTTPADIQTAIDIHKSIIADGSMAVSDNELSNYSETAVYTDYCIVYKLKDGSEFIRSYPVMKLSTLYSTLAVEETDAYKTFREDTIKNLFGRLPVKDYSTATLAVSDNMLSDVTRLNLTAEENQELINALAADKSKGGIEQFYHPAEDCLGVIWLDLPNEGRNYITLGTPGYICVYKTDSETMAWLQQKGLTDLFDKEYTVKSIQLFAVNRYNSNSVKQWAVDRLFVTRYNADIFTRPSASIDLGYVPESDFQAVLSKSRVQYFTDIGNKYAVITLINENGEEIITTKFIAE